MKLTTGRQQQPPNAVPGTTAQSAVRGPSFGASGNVSQSASGSANFSSGDGTQAYWFLGLMAVAAYLVWKG